VLVRCCVRAGHATILPGEVALSESHKSGAVRNKKAYAAKLGQLTGDAFESAVCELLQGTFLDFQDVPRNPGGDGGIDGLTHELTRAYCCYGPVLQASPTTTSAELARKIIRKFRGDVRRILEIDAPNCAHKPNTVLEGVLAVPGVKLKAIRLVSNWVDAHRIIGRLNKSFKSYNEANSR